MKWFKKWDRVDLAAGIALIVFVSVFGVIAWAQTDTMFPEGLGTNSGQRTRAASAFDAIPPQNLDPTLGAVGGTLDINGDVKIGNKVVLRTDATTFLDLLTAKLQIAGVEFFEAQEGAGDFFLINPAGTSVALRVDGDTNDNVLFVSTTFERVGINDGNPAILLDIKSDTTFGYVLQIIANGSDNRIFSVFEDNGDGRLSVWNSGIEDFRIAVNGGDSWLDTGGNFGFGTNTPDVELHILDSSGGSTPELKIENDAKAWSFQVNGGSVDELEVIAEGTVQFQIVDDGQATFTNGLIVNQGGADSDFRVESINEVSMIIVDASTDRVGFGITAPEDTVHIVGEFHLEEVSGGEDWQIGVDAAGDLNFFDSGGDGTKNVFSLTDSMVTIQYTKNEGSGDMTLIMDRYDDAPSDNPRIIARHFRGTSLAPTATQDNDTLFQMLAGGHDTSGSTGASIEFYADAEWGTSGDASDSPARIEFYTVPDGSSTFAKRMSIMSNGNIANGSHDPTSEYHIQRSGVTINPIYERVDSSIANGNVIAQVEVVGGEDGSEETVGRWQIEADENWTSSSSGTRFLIATTNSGSTSDVERMRITMGGDMGIGETSPGARLDVKDSSATVAIFNRTTTSGTIISLQSDGVEEGSISVDDFGVVSYNAFTGSHFCFSDVTLERGDLVRMTGINRNTMTGSTVTDPTYGVEPTTTVNDSGMLGVFLTKQNPDPEYEQKRFDIAVEKIKRAKLAADPFVEITLEETLIEEIATTTSLLFVEEPIVVIDNLGDPALSAIIREIEVVEILFEEDEVTTKTITVVRDDLLFIGDKIFRPRTIEEITLTPEEEPEFLDDPLLVMSVGNGFVKIVDEGDDIEPGSFLISSSVAGHAREYSPDSDEFPLVFIFGVATETVIWANEPQPPSGPKTKTISCIFDRVIERWKRGSTTPPP